MRNYFVPYLFVCLMRMPIDNYMPFCQYITTQKKNSKHSIIMYIKIPNKVKFMYPKTVLVILSRDRLNTFQKLTSPVSSSNAHAYIAARPSRGKTHPSSPFSSANCFASSYVTSLWASKSHLLPIRKITCTSTHTYTHSQNQKTPPLEKQSYTFSDSSPQNPKESYSF